MQCDCFGLDHTTLMNQLSETTTIDWVKMKNTVFFACCYADTLLALHLKEYAKLFT